jgi:hypothetical protein
MGTVLVSLDEKHETLLRELTHERGMKKGAMSFVVQDALDELNKKRSKKIVKERILNWLSKGEKFTYKMYKNRSEIYD